MEPIWIWLGFALVIALLMLLNRKQHYSKTVRSARSGLSELAEKFRNGRSEERDLEKWEQYLAQLEAHPNEYNRLDSEIGLRQAFAGYLEKHYPHDGRLPDWKEAAAWKKDSIWGFKIDRGGKK